jgi:xanthine/uracil permease
MATPTTLQPALQIDAETPPRLWTLTRRVAYAIAVIFGVIAFLPLISVALALMPKPVMGGITLFTGCLVMINGLQTMIASTLDQRRTVVLGLGIIAGLAAEKYPHMAAGLPDWVQMLTGSSLVFGTMVGLIANLLLPRTPFGWLWPDVIGPAQLQRLDVTGHRYPRRALQV